jgi:FkbM family methyltransferase
MLEIIMSVEFHKTITKDINLYNYLENTPIFQWIIINILQPLRDNDFNFSLSLYCIFANTKSAVRGYKLRIEFLKCGLFKAKYNDREIIFSQPNRYFYFKRGIDNRLDILERNYLLKHVSFNEGDHVVDCGANIGEFGMCLRKYGVNYHGFEPEELEAQCCDLNNFDGQRRTNRIALWKEQTKLKLYSKPESADSSAFPAENNLKVLEVPATTLEAYMLENHIDRIKFAKIEAEGAEPEVLEGARAVLHLVDYIAVDCGFERGVKNESTFYECNKILCMNEFEIIDADLQRNSFLYKRC